MYYLLFTAEQLEINTNEHSLVFLGEVSKKIELIHDTKLYFKEVSLIAPMPIDTNIAIDKTILVEEFELFNL
jgi:hypothetical protein